MKFITNRISVGASKSFDQLVADYQAKKTGQVKTASANESNIRTAEGVERSDPKQEEGVSSGQLDVEPLHQVGESTPKVKHKDGDKDQGIKDKVVSSGKAKTKAAESSIVDKDNENNDDAEESGQTKADFPKLTNDPEAGKHRDGDGDQKKKKTEAKGDISNFGKNKAAPFGSEKKDEKKEKDCLDGGAMAKKDDKKEKKCATGKRKFIRVANLDSKSKAWLKKYWTKIYMADYADSMTVDK